MDKLFFYEKFRYGTSELFKRLKLQNHDILIYTTSLRSVWYVRLRFLILGINLGGVINQGKHLITMKSYNGAGRSARKYPPAFGIDLLIDDLEGEKYGFSVLCIKPENADWTQNILEFINDTK